MTTATPAPASADAASASAAPPGALHGELAGPVPARLTRWLLAVLLALPAFLPVATHYLRARAAGVTPTGFTMYDMAYYMANAREHFDDGRFRPTYGNPFSVRYDTPRIYFQPHTLLLAAVWRVTGWDPGVVFTLFGVVAAVACARVAVALYESVVGLGGAARYIGLVLFFWGGGVLALFGGAYVALHRLPAKDLFHFDPTDGLWFLNFGRNLILPTEAYYHALFLGCVLCLVRGRFTAALALALLTSVSHPFTGVELLVVVASWLLLERYFLEDRRVPPRHCVVALAGIVLHVGYYLVFMGRFDEHRAVMDQWSLEWLLQAVNFVPADLLVGGLALWRVRRYPLARAVFSSPANRLFAVWFLVAFALANHEFAIDPIQPLHFTRGYTWIPLFLLGAPVLLGLLATLLRWRRPLLRAVAVAALVGLFLSDNLAWLATYPLRASLRGWTLTAEQKQVMDYLGADDLKGALLLSEDAPIGYLATVYTPLRSWHSHEWNTPWAQRRRDELEGLFRRGEFLPEWEGRPVVVIRRIESGNPATAPATSAGVPATAAAAAATRESADPEWVGRRGGVRVLETEGYVVYRFTPATASPPG